MKLRKLNSCFGDCSVTVRFFYNRMKMMRQIRRHRRNGRNRGNRGNRTYSIGWLHAVVLGPNNGIVSTVSLALKVVAAGPNLMRLIAWTGGQCTIGSWHLQFAWGNGEKLVRHMISMFEHRAAK